MAEQKKMKLNYKLTFLIGFGFIASSIAWSVYNAYVPPILDEMLSASPTVAGIAEKLPWLATLFGGTDVVGAGVVWGGCPVRSWSSTFWRYFSAAVRQNFRPDAQPFG